LRTEYGQNTPGTQSSYLLETMPTTVNLYSLKRSLCLELTVSTQRCRNISVLTFLVCFVTLVVIDDGSAGKGKQGEKAEGSGKAFEGRGTSTSGAVNEALATPEMPSAVRSDKSPMLQLIEPRLTADHGGSSAS
jgi:hypothetical protein